MLLDSSLQNPPQVLKSVQIGVFCLSFCILSHSDVKQHSLTPLALIPISGIASQPRAHMQNVFEVNNVT